VSFFHYTDVGSFESEGIIGKARPQSFRAARARSPSAYRYTAISSAMINGL